MMRGWVFAVALLAFPVTAQAWPSWLWGGGGSETITPAERPPPLDFGGKTGDCAITFDDGPGQRTPTLLKLLADRQIKATFFVLGEHARRYPELIRQMVLDGHEVENHSWDHPDMRKLGDAARQKEIEDTVAQLKSLGAEPKFFRPPYGSYDPALVALAHRDGLELVLWSRDSEDWRYHTVASLEAHILPIGQGAHGIFLFHDIHESTIAAMGGVLDDLKSRGCRFVTIAQYRAANPGPESKPKGQESPVRPVSVTPQ